VEGSWSRRGRSSPEVTLVLSPNIGLLITYVYKIVTWKILILCQRQKIILFLL
jgi:hypothetical protein